MAKAAFKGRRLFSLADWTEINEESSEVLHLEHSILWC
jgi:hypothetical protein